MLWVSGAPLDGELVVGSHLAVFLKPCRECNKEVAEFAMVCLHCGAKWPGTGMQFNWERVVLLSVIGCILFGLIGGFLVTVLGI